MMIIENTGCGYLTILIPPKYETASSLNHSWSSPWYGKIPTPKWGPTWCGLGLVGLLCGYRMGEKKKPYSYLVRYLFLSSYDIVYHNPVTLLWFEVVFRYVFCSILRKKFSDSKLVWRVEHSKCWVFRQVRK